MASRVRLAGVSKSFGTRSVLASVDLSVEPGESLAILGPSGSGKSTLLHIVGSLEPPDAGEVWVGEERVDLLQGRALEAFRSSQIGFVFQEHHLLSHLTALENVLLPTLARPVAEAPGRARSLLESLGLAEAADRRPGRLSGGERQRVAVARALLASPGLLLCDEPTGQLDADSGAALVDLLAGLAREGRATVLMVTHHEGHAGRFGRRLRLSGGRLV